MDSLRQLNLLSLLITLQELREDIILKSFLNFLSILTSSNKIEEIFNSYVDFVSALNNVEDNDFSIYLKRLFYKNKTMYKTSLQLEKEQKILSYISKVGFEDIKNVMVKNFKDADALKDFLPEFQNSKADIEEKTKDIDFITEDIFYNNKAFIFDNDLEIKPVEFCDKICFANLKGYAEQKKIIYENTTAFLEDKKVNNVLLYGDAGCGKSSTVRALLNEFQNLKMIQVFKNNIINLDKLFAKLNDVPYKFIIFADDISFDDNDSSFSTMKAVLEGSLIQCPPNAVIYATSNRRHLVRESFQSRAGDEVHLKDTMNELNSLSDRFGINLLFKKPTMDEYINIVLELAADNNISVDKDCLIEKAKKASLAKGSTAPRVAKQMIDNILAYVNA